MLNANATTERIAAAEESPRPTLSLFGDRRLFSLSSTPEKVAKDAVEIPIPNDVP
jgi:hypothetical protein